MWGYIMAKNKVIAGDYVKYRVKAGWNTIVFQPPLLSRHDKIINIDSTTVQSYQLVNSEYRNSAVSGFIRGLIGKYFFGLLGMLVGIFSSRSRGVYTVSLNFHDGKRSLIEIGDRQYKVLIKSVF